MAAQKQQEAGSRHRFSGWESPQQPVQQPGLQADRGKSSKRQGPPPSAPKTSLHSLVKGSAEETACNLPTCNSMCTCLLSDATQLLPNADQKNYAGNEVITDRSVIRKDRHQMYIEGFLSKNRFLGWLPPLKSKVICSHHAPLPFDYRSQSSHPGSRKAGWRAHQHACSQWVPSPHLDSPRGRPPHGGSYNVDCTYAQASHQFSSGLMQEFT